MVVRQVKQLRHASSVSVFKWDDAFLMRNQLTEEERMIHDAAHEFCQAKLAPRIIEANKNEHFDVAIMKEMGEAGLLGPTLQGYGCAGVNYGIHIYISIV